MALTLAELEIQLKAVGIELTKKQLYELQGTLKDTDKQTKLTKDSFSNFGNELNNFNAKSLSKTIVGTTALIGTLYKLVNSIKTATLETKNLSEAGKENLKTVQEFGVQWDKASAKVGSAFLAMGAAAAKAFNYLAEREAAAIELQKKRIAITNESVKAQMDAWDTEKKIDDERRKATIAAFNNERDMTKQRIKFYSDLAAAQRKQAEEQMNNYDNINSRIEDRIIKLQNQKIAESDLSDEVKKRIVIDQDYTAMLNEIHKQEAAGLITKQQANELIAKENQLRKDQLEGLKQLTSAQERYNRLISQGINPGTGNPIAKNFNTGTEISQAQVDANNAARGKAGIPAGTGTPTTESMSTKSGGK